MKGPALFSLVCVVAATTATGGEFKTHSFKKQVLNPEFWAEGASAGDFNHDGTPDVVAGPYWYEGPAFQKRHAFYAAEKSFKVKKDDGSEVTLPGFEGALGKNNNYSDNFFAFVYDFNGDRWDDILILGFPGQESWWFENPKAGDDYWKRHTIFAVTDNESPTFEDITGDGKPDLVCGTSSEVAPGQRKGALGYATVDWSDPTKPWVFHAITPVEPRFQRFTHGLGVGDVNGDGRKDILEAGGWWEQPASLSGDSTWKAHPFQFGTGGAQMYTYDVNGDGRNDVITSLAAHGFGLAWFENVSDDQGGITFKEHVFMNKEARENRYGIKFAQLHAIDLVDMDGDGLKDIVTGKRFWAHGPTGDAEPSAPAVVYWFKLVRQPDKTVDFVPYLVDNDSGVGTQVVATDLNGDKLPDIVVGNKKGAFVHLHSVKAVSQGDWEAAQPKPLASAR